MRYLSLTEGDRKEMLSSIGVDNVKDLYQDVPKNDFSSYNLPDGLNEQELVSYFKTLSSKNLPAGETKFFLGAGCYRHFVPSVVDAVISRGEFLTSYTSYQPEISQGTLVAIFEFQSMICELTGMDIANASMYDGATATNEAIQMAKRLNKKKEKIVIANRLNPDYLRVVNTYLEDKNIFTDETDIDNKTACVVVSYPDYYGEPKDLSYYRKKCDEVGAILVVVNTEIVALGLLPAPKEADIVVGEGQSLGVGMVFGGPHLGYFACKKQFVRQMPGRICGVTKDKERKECYVLTLNAREQHIRRAKATSNICSNQGLNMLAFTVHLALLGGSGFKKLAKLNHYKAILLSKEISKHSKIKILNKHFFNEFVIQLPIKSDDFLVKMKAENILAGVKISDDKILVTTTELNSDKDIVSYGEALTKII